MEYHWANIVNKFEKLPMQLTIAINKRSFKIIVSYTEKANPNQCLLQIQSKQ